MMLQLDAHLSVALCPVSMNDSVRCVELRPGIADEARIIRETATLLHTEWPAVSMKHRVSTLQDRIRQYRDNRHSAPAMRAVPRTIVMLSPPSIIERKDRSAEIEFGDDSGSGGRAVVMGHSAIQLGSSQADGNSCVVYSVLIAPAFRRRGLGQRLMTFTEQVARELGFDYVSLSTPDMQHFYEKCGFIVCPPVSSLRANARRLDSDAVSRLEAIFGRRMQSKGKDQNAAGRADAAISTADEVWLRKRIKEKLPSTVVSDAHAVAMMCDRLRLYRNLMEGKTLCFFRNIPKQKQIGPSCGLVVIRMIQDYVSAGTGGAMRTLLSFSCGSSDSNGSGIHEKADLQCAHGKMVGVKEQKDNDRTDGAAGAAATGATSNAVVETPCSFHTATEQEKCEAVLLCLKALRSVAGKIGGVSASTDGGTEDEVQAMMSAASQASMYQKLPKRSTEEGSPLSLLQLAISLNFSKDGEMYDAGHMASLAHYCFAGRDHECSVQLLQISPEAVLRAILCENAMCIVPYDRGADNSPAFQKGKRAHWLLVHGIMSQFDGDEVTFIGQQGMSVLPVVASLADLCASCNQLDSCLRLRGRMVTIQIL